jgi:hypothetical protein
MLLEFVDGLIRLYLVLSFKFAFAHNFSQCC